MVEVKLKLNKETLDMLKEFSEGTGLTVDSVVEVLLKPFLLRTEYFKNVLKKYVDKLGVLERKCFLIVDYGVSLSYLLNSLAKELGLKEDELVLIDMDFLKDMKGLWLVLNPIPSPYIDEMTIQLQSDDTFYIEASSIVCFEEDVGKRKYRRYVRKLEDAIKTPEVLSLCGTLEEELEECGDIGEVSVETYDFDGTLHLVVKVYGGSWLCIPKISKVNRIFKKIYAKSRLTRLRKL